MSEISSAGGPTAYGGSASLAVHILELIAGGQATSRAELGERLGAAASTVSLTVQQLVSKGLLAEEGTHASTGGRPRKVLRLGGSEGFAVAADLGGSHVRIGVVHSGGSLANVATLPFTLTDGPDAGLARLGDLLADLAATAVGGVLCAVGVSLPGPVDVAAGSLSLPARMPGWNGFPVRDWLEQRLGVPAAVDNDANLMALGEHSVRPPEARQSITVKAGSAIGLGIIADGQVYRGANGAAGDITHVRLNSAGGIPCSCGNIGCLETVASGAALVRQLREREVAVVSILDVVRLASEGHPEATSAVRLAGRRLGEVLAANVNFFNPDAVYLGGILSTLEPFVAAVRSQLYESCHPLATQHLVIERTRTGVDAGLLGAGLFGLQHAFTSALETLTSTNQALHRMPRPNVSR